AVGRCGCEGYTTDPAAIAEAVEIVEVAELRLRGPDEPRPTRVAPVAPARDLFDETRRVGGRDEAAGSAGGRLAERDAGPTRIALRDAVGELRELLERHRRISLHAQPGEELRARDDPHALGLERLAAPLVEADHRRHPHAH